ncbi:hypothetical protein HYPSUDRAFT_43264 [Hypholoma sublateritium FD-334 SS-4]|uniref:Uncharacterized protein n=1 Tax=Hypholoma sublateritium (strain FD-334 SS-4) TaxID=945553 RepID=A0A0D2MAH0_HYPSF|nr:hypothetical protein HYPSUDRAFT_43264 [Hypholoma sublateritium FD-334 SS-4]
MEKHNISAILAQIESEKAAELAPQRTDETVQESTVLNEPQKSRGSVKHDEAKAGPLVSADPDGEPEGANRAVVRDGKMKAVFRRIQNLGRKKNTVVLSSKPTAEVGTSVQKRGTTKVKSWFA